jgi:nucleosome binding factor SPN SPT16 subunit
VIPKDTAQGPFVNEWKKIYASQVEDVEEFDVSSAFSAFFAVKDDVELVSKFVLLTEIKI